MPAVGSFAGVKLSTCVDCCKTGITENTICKQITLFTGVSWAWWLGPANPVHLGFDPKAICAGENLPLALE